LVRPRDSVHESAHIVEIKTDAALLRPRFSEREASDITTQRFGGSNLSIVFSRLSRKCADQCRRAGPPKAGPALWRDA
jgi:hypothetical protein